MTSGVRKVGGHFLVIFFMSFLKVVILRTKNHVCIPNFWKNKREQTKIPQGGSFKLLLFSPLFERSFGEMIQIWRINIFQMGWFKPPTSQLFTSIFFGIFLAKSRTTTLGHLVPKLPHKPAARRSQLLQYLEDHPRPCKWLLTVLSKSPYLGLFRCSPSKWPFHSLWMVVTS